MSNRSLLTSFCSFGPVGFLPAPGTWASLVVVIAAYWFNSYAGIGWQAILLFVISLLSYYAVYQVQQLHKVDDPSWIVVDELVGMYLSVIGVPVFWELYVAAFFLFRFFDILKPWFIGSAERLSGPFGVIMDDVFAGIVTRLIMAGIVYVGHAYCS